MDAERVYSTTTPGGTPPTRTGAARPPRQNDAEHTMAAATKPERLMTAEECTEYHGYGSTTSWHTAVSRGKAPAPVPGSKPPVWRAAEVAKYQRTRGNMRSRKGKAPKLVPPVPGDVLWDAEQCATVVGMPVQQWHKAVRQGEAPAPGNAQQKFRKWWRSEVVAYSNKKHPAPTATPTPTPAPTGELLFGPPTAGGTVVYAVYHVQPTTGAWRVAAVYGLPADANTAAAALPGAKVAAVAWHPEGEAPPQQVVVRVYKYTRTTRNGGPPRIAQWEDVVEGWEHPGIHTTGTADSITARGTCGYAELAAAVAEVVDERGW